MFIYLNALWAMADRDCRQGKLTQYFTTNIMTETERGAMKETATAAAIYGTTNGFLQLNP